MTRYLLLCGRAGQKKEEKKAKGGKKIVNLEEEKIVRWAIDNKEDWERKEEVEADHRKIKKMVSKKFLKWRKVFRKVELERMLTRKTWDHAIDLKEIFKLQKRRIYPLSKDEREEVQKLIGNMGSKKVFTKMNLR